MWGLLLLSSLVHAGDGARFVGTAEGGARYLTNLNAEPGEDAIGSASWSGSARLGASASWGRKAVVASVRYTGSVLPDVPDLSSHTGQLEVGLRMPISWRVSVSVLPGVGGRWYADPARSALTAGANGSIDYRLRPRVDVGVLAGVQWVGARDAAFSSVDTLAGVDLTWRPGRTRLRLEPWVTGRAGRIVRYSSTPLVTVADLPGSGQRGDGRGSGGEPGERQAVEPVTTFGVLQTATSVPAVALTGGLTIEQGIGEVLYLRAQGFATRVLAEPAPYTDGSVGLAVGARLR